MGAEEFEVCVCQSKLMKLDRCDADNTHLSYQRSVESIPCVVNIAFADNEGGFPGQVFKVANGTRQHNPWC